VPPAEAVFELYDPRFARRHSEPQRRFAAALAARVVYGAEAPPAGSGIHRRAVLRVRALAAAPLPSDCKRRGGGAARQKRLNGAIIDCQPRRLVRRPSSQSIPSQRRSSTAWRSAPAFTRGPSRSSMRSTIRHPRRRASSQLTEEGAGVAEVEGAGGGGCQACRFHWRGTL
jgi:hypothetical protein